MYPKRKPTIIPNIVGDQYFRRLAGRPPFADFHNYVLCTGNVCARKNQLALAQACLSAQASLLIIGDVLPGEEVYGRALKSAIEGKALVRWLPKMEPKSDAL